jgi:hypothetical protein
MSTVEEKQLIGKAKVQLLQNIKKKYEDSPLNIMLGSKNDLDIGKVKRNVTLKDNKSKFQKTVLHSRSTQAHS